MLALMLPLDNCEFGSIYKAHHSENKQTAHCVTATAACLINSLCI